MISKPFLFQFLQLWMRAASSRNRWLYLSPLIIYFEISQIVHYSNWRRSLFPDVWSIVINQIYRYIFQRGLHLFSGGSLFQMSVASFISNVGHSPIIINLNLLLSLASVHFSTDSVDDKNELRGFFFGGVITYPIGKLSCFSVRSGFTIVYVRN